MAESNQREKTGAGPMSPAVRSLRKKRSEYIKAEIRAEGGCSGALRRLGFPWVGGREACAGFSDKHGRYIDALDSFRLAVIKEFQQNSRNVFSASIATIYQITVVDEIERVKIEKERILRSRGIQGLVREKAEEYRESSPSLKMLLGTFFILSGAVLYVFNVTDYLLLQFFFLSFGLMIFLEGLQQDVSRWEGINKGLTRQQIYRKAKRRIAATEPAEVAAELKQIHLDLESQIWKVRQFEKRAEYSRYLLAGLGGAVIGFVLAYIQSPELALESLILTAVSRIFWFILPFGLIQLFFLERSNYFTPEKYPKETDLMIRAQN